MFTLFTLFPGFAFAWQTTLFLEEGIGRLKGYTQTPRGGDYNTTSLERPSYDDVGVSTDLFFHGEIALSHRYLFAFVDYYELKAEGAKALDHDLLTHSKFIPHGFSFDMNTKYDWFQAGFGFDSRHLFDNWRIKPRVAANWLKYSYEFTSPFASSQRSFDLISATLGVNIERYISDCFFIDAFGEISLPVSELRLYDGSIGLNYTVLLSSKWAFYPRLSVGFLSIDYEDRQNVPNHLSYQNAPYIALGIKLALN